MFVCGKVTMSFLSIFFRHLTILGWFYCKQQTDVSFLRVSPLFDDKLRDHIVKVCCGTIRLRLVVPQLL